MHVQCNYLSNVCPKIGILDLGFLRPISVIYRVFAIQGCLLSVIPLYACVCSTCKISDCKKKLWMAVESSVVMLMAGVDLPENTRPIYLTH